MSRSSLVGVAVLLLLCCALPLASAISIDETLSDFIDTSNSGTLKCTSSTSFNHPDIHSFYFHDITQFENLHYIAFTLPGDVSRLPEGRNALSYSLGDHTDYGVVYVDKTRNALGSVTYTRFSFLPNNWNSYGLTGGQYLRTNRTFFDASYGQGFSNPNGLKIELYGIQPGVSGWMRPAVTYDLAYSSDVSWRNRLTVVEKGNDYYISLQRIFDNTKYRSQLNITKDGVTVYSSDAITDVNVFFGTPQVDELTVTSSTKSYTYRLGESGGTPPPETSKFSISLSPENGIGSPITATLTPAADAPAYDYVNWQFDDPGSPYETTYQKIAGTWKKYNPETDAYDLAVTGTEYLSPIFTPTRAGYTYIACQVYDLAGGKKLADLIAYVTVSDKVESDIFPVDLQVFDADSGGGLLRVNLDVKNLQTGETTSTLIQTESVGHRLLLQVGNTYDLTVSKSGYESRTFTRVGSTTKALTARLPKSVSSDPGQVWLYFYVLDGSQAPISGAAVQLSGLSTTLTNSQGLAKIPVSTNTTYQYTVSKADYTGVSDEIIIESASQWKYVTLTPTGAAPTSPLPTGPGAVTTPDYRSIDEKAESALSILFDLVEPFAALAGLVLLCNMLFWIVPGGKR
jgi:hypothetical protein